MSDAASELATDQRRAELAANLARVQGAIVEACGAVGRDPAEVTLIVVTKTWPVSDVRALAALGVGQMGENRDQEAAVKARACADLDLRWHFLGQLQTNKCHSVVGYADVVHSVDRLKLVRALSAAAQQRGRVVSCLVQVNLDPPEQVESGSARSGPWPAGRGGVVPVEVPALADAIAEASGLTLGGVMAVAPHSGRGDRPGADPASAFATLGEISHELRMRHPLARVISAGMSGDFTSAIAVGATHVRLGAAVLGLRPILR